MIGRVFLRGGVLVLALLWATFAGAQDSGKPLVRAITGFVRITADDYQPRIAEALSVLRAAKSDFEAQGYKVDALRIVTQPASQIVQGLSDAQALALFKALDELGTKEEFTPSVGAAMLRDSDDPRAMHLIAKALSVPTRLHANASIAGADGIHWTVIRESADLVRHLADDSTDSRGTLFFTGTAMVEPYSPFFPGAYHDGPGKVFSVGLEGASVVQEVFARTHGDFNRSVVELTRQLTVHAKAAEAIGTRVASAKGWTFAGVDPTPAPRPGVSIGGAIETYTGARFGSSGTMTAALIITTAVKAVPVKQVGYSGLMIPIMEDDVLSRRWAEKAITIDSMLAYSAVCGTGLDTIPLPGATSVEQLGRIFGDVASLAWKWKKPLSARLQPIKGKGAGDPTPFKSRFLSNTKIQELP